MVVPGMDEWEYLERQVEEDERCIYTGPLAQQHSLYRSHRAPSRGLPSQKGRWEGEASQQAFGSPVALGVTRGRGAAGAVQLEPCEQIGRQRDRSSDRSRDLTSYHRARPPVGPEPAR